MKKALLVYPRTPPTYWSFEYAVKLQGRSSAFPPLGALTIASFFPDDEWKVRLVDQNVEPLTDAHLRDADAVFISAMTVHQKSVADIIRRAHHSGKRVVLGGPYASTHLPTTKTADHIVDGEAEPIMQQLLEDIVCGTAKPEYKAQERPHLSMVPLPRWDLVDLRNYGSAPVQYSRGCPFACEFCDITKIYGRNPRVKTHEAFLREFDELYCRGWRGSVFVVDDNFIGNLPAIKSMMPLVAEWQRLHNYPFDLFTEASVNLAHEDCLLEHMVQAGFRKVFLGIETSVVESLKETRKFQNLRGNLRESVRNIQKKGIQVMAGFIIGFDNDPENVFELQEEFIRDSGIPVAMVGLLNAIPGTDLYGRLEKEGRLRPDEWQGNNTDGTLNFIPRIDRKKLVEGYRALMHKLYSPREFYQRATRFLERASDAQLRGRMHISLGDVSAFAKSLFVQGLRDPGRFQYWKYILNAALHHRYRFEEAITLAVMGHHFRKVNAIYLGSSE